MATVKITELPAISIVNANTANTVIVGVDIPTTTTGKMTLTTLALGLYSNNVLYVGNNATSLPNVSAQFTGNSSNYLQINLENQQSNGSADIVITADTGDDENYYVDLGLNNSNYNYPGYTFANPLDGYLVVQGSNTNPALPGGNLIVGTTIANKDVIITQGSFDKSGAVARFIYDTGFKLLKKPLIFADGTSQNTSVDYITINSRITANAESANVVMNSRITANAASANSVINTRISSNIATQNAFTQAAFDKANNALPNTTGVFAGSLTVSNNLTVSQNSSFVGTINAQKGIIYTPRILTNSQTAITIDFSTDSIVRASFNSTLTNSFTNYAAGKVVELWVTNTSGTNQTINHGCLANNSSVGSTSFTVSSDHTACLKYISFGTDISQAFVAVIN